MCAAPQSIYFRVGSIVRMVFGMPAAQCSLCEPWEAASHYLSHGLMLSRL